MTSGPIQQGPIDPQYLIMDKNSLRLGDGLYQPFAQQIDDVLDDALRYGTGHMAVGDLTSDERGTGARANSDKVQLDLLPLAEVSNLLTPNTDAQRHVKNALWALGQFQAGGNVADLRVAFQSTAMAAGLTLQELIDDAAAVLEYGKVKYSAWNWLKGMPYSVCIGCAARHLMRKMWIDPKSQDEESGQLHAAHVACNLLFLMTYMTTYRDGDDRPKHLQREG